MRTIFLFFFITVILVKTEVRSQSLEISLPLNQSVFQRNASGKATVVFAGQVLDADAVRLEYKVQRLDAINGNVVSDQLPVTILATPSKGLFRWQMELPTGWYKFVVRGLTSADEEVANTRAEVKAGVGEVVFAAGQSNIQGVELNSFGGPPTLPEYDALNAVNQDCWCKGIFPFPVFSRIRAAADTEFKIAPNGNQNAWLFQAFGKSLMDRAGGVPVVFFNAGATATTMSNWMDSALQPNGITGHPWWMNCPDNPEGQPYKNLKVALNYYGGMFGARGIVWHQGESDSYLFNERGQPTTAEEYKSKLNTVINKTREQFDGGLGWAVSLVSYFNGHTYHEVIEGQRLAKNSNVNTVWGAYYSDEITGADRDATAAHFTSGGLTKMGEMLGTGTTGSFPLPPGGADILQLSPVSPLLSPPLVVVQNSDHVNISVQGNYASYCWVTETPGHLDDFNIKNCAYPLNTQSINVSTGKWRCYVGNDKGNIMLTQSVKLPLAGINIPLGFGISY